MSLNEITKELHYNTPALKAKVYFGLLALVKGGGVSYGEKRGKERLFALTGKDLIVPGRKKRVVAPKAGKVAKTTKVDKTPKAVSETGSQTVENTNIGHA